MTSGISPKVLIPVVLQVVVGAILLLTGHDTEGVTLLLTAAGTGGVGYAADPGDVTEHVGPHSDDLLQTP